MPIQAKVDKDVSTREITIKVSGAPDIDVTEPWQKRQQLIRPDRVDVRIVDGEVRSVIVHGPLVRKDGTTGRNSSRIAYRKDDFVRRYCLDQAPDWVRAIWTEAPAGMTNWAWPDSDG